MLYQVISDYVRLGLVSSGCIMLGEVSSG